MWMLKTGKEQMPVVRTCLKGNVKSDHKIQYNYTHHALPVQVYLITLQLTITI